MSTDLQPAADNAPAEKTLATDPAARRAFLTYIIEHPDCSVREAIETTGYRRKDVRALLATDQEFAEDYREARGYGADTIRAEIRRRAIDGIEEPVFNKDGDQVGVRVTYSDRLLAMMAKAHLPEYRESTTLTVQGDHEHPVEVRVEHTAESVGAVLSGLAAVGLIRPGPALTGHPEDQPVLPARTD